MENREDLESILPFLPLLLRSSNLFWPSQVVESLKTLSKGPLYSHVDSGELLFNAISPIRDSLALPSLQRLAPFAHEGYALFFDGLSSRAEAAKWFKEVVPALANLLLRLPSLLEIHYQNADNLLTGIKTSLRLLGQQEAGIIFLSQELIGAFVTCAFFCLYPVFDRGAKRLPTTNFDHLFEAIDESYSEKHENKIKCIIHYFERICSSIPEGIVPFERKVLPLEKLPLCVSYPEADFWSKSVFSLRPFEVHSSGFIEDHSNGGLEVGFPNNYPGGGALHRGCLQVPMWTTGMLIFSEDVKPGLLTKFCFDEALKSEVLSLVEWENRMFLCSPLPPSSVEFVTMKTLFKVAWFLG